MQKQSVLQSSPSYLLWQSNNSRQRELKKALQPTGLTYIDGRAISLRPGARGVIVFNQANKIVQAIDKQRLFPLKGRTK